MSDKTTYYQENREKIINRAKKYYENNKEILREKARNKYKELPNEEKKKKKNMEEIKEYQKNYCDAKKITIRLKDQSLLIN